VVIEWPNLRFSFSTPLTETGAADALTGKITEVRISDPAESSKPTRILETSDPCEVEVTWQLSGPAVSVVGGTWHVELYLDQINGSQQVKIGPVNVPVIITGDPTPFDVRFFVPPGTVEEGVYNLVALITHSGTGESNELTGMGGNAELGTVQFLRSEVESNL
jgi:hypothetical protein